MLRHNEPTFWANRHSTEKENFVSPIGKGTSDVDQHNVKNEIGRLKHEPELVIFDEYEYIPVATYEKYPLMALRDCLVTSTATFPKTEVDVDEWSHILAYETIPPERHIYIDDDDGKPMTNDELNNRCLQDANRHIEFRANGYSKEKEHFVSPIGKENRLHVKNEIGRSKHEAELVIFDVAPYEKYPLVALRDFSPTIIAAVAPFPKTEIDTDETTPLEHHVNVDVFESERSFQCYKCRLTFLDHKECRRHILSSLCLSRKFPIVKLVDCMKTYGGTANQKSSSPMSRRNGLVCEYECYICKHVLVNAESLRKHLMESHPSKSIHRKNLIKNRGQSNGRTGCLSSEHDTKRYVCKYVNCGKAFVAKYNMNRHYLTHEKNRPRPYMCPFPQCGKSYADRDILKVHSLTHKADSPLACDQCDKTFKWTNSLRSHKLSHSDSRSFPCDYENCGKSFKTTGELKAHKLIHSDQRLFACTHPDCDKKFKTSALLSFHGRVHWSDRPFVCECGTGFKSKPNLQRHRRTTHLGEKAYKCTYQKCGKKFTCKSSLVGHTRSHLGDKPYICTYEQCDKEFTTNNGLRSHKQTHSIEAPFSCSFPNCGKKYKWKRSLKSHQLNHKS